MCIASSFCLFFTEFEEGGEKKITLFASIKESAHVNKFNYGAPPCKTSRMDKKKKKEEGAKQRPVLAS